MRGSELLVIEAEALHDSFDHGLHITLVVDHEFFGMAEWGGLARSGGRNLQGFDVDGGETRTQKEWNVEMTGLAMLSPPTSFSTRSAFQQRLCWCKVIARSISGK